MCQILIRLGYKYDQFISYTSFSFGNCKCDLYKLYLISSEFK